APRLLPTLPIEHRLNPPECPIRLPPRQVVKERTARWQIFRNRPPLTARTQQIQHPIEDFPDIHAPLAPAPACRGDEGSKHHPLLVGHIAGIAQFVAIVPGAILGRPHGWPSLLPPYITTPSFHSRTS